MIVSMNNRLLLESEKYAMNILENLNQSLYEMILMESKPLLASAVSYEPSSLNIIYEVEEGSNKMEEINSDDEPSEYEVKQEEVPEEHEDKHEDERLAPGEMDPNQMSPEQLLLAELDATQEKLIQLNIYKELTEFRKNLDFSIDNISNNKITNTEIIEKLNYYKTLLEVLQELIYVLNPSTTYMLYGTTKLEVTKLLKEYIINRDKNKEKINKNKDYTNVN